MKITPLIILILYLNINNSETDINNIIEYLHQNLKDEINNFNILNKTTELYMNELKAQNHYIKFIQNLNENNYYSLQKDNKDSINLESIIFSKSIHKSNCVASYLLIGEKQQLFFLCINELYNLIALYNLSSINEDNAFKIPLNLNLNFSNYIKVSFSPFDEGESKFYIFNGNSIYSIHIKLNYTLDSFKIAYINNFTIHNNATEISESEKINNLIYLSTTLYHGNRYIIYGYQSGEIKVYLLLDRNKNYYISTRTIFNMNKIHKIYHIQGFLFIITDNRKKIKILSLLGSNSILINCYNFNDIVDLVYDYKNNLLYVLDIKGNIFIKELSLITDNRKKIKILSLLGSKYIY